MLPEDGLYRYLLQPGEEQDDQCKRATDRIWSKKTYRFSKIVEDSGNRVIYHLSDGPERAFLSEELMLIPEDTRVASRLCSEMVISVQLGQILLRPATANANGDHEFFSSFRHHEAVVLSAS